nr:hypothetical protein Hi04_10k_c2089_00017 [uncultured bacterium]
MTKYILSISIGPVQEFIAAGRRTNDLYKGSELISEATKVAARALRAFQAAGCQLIFPTAEMVADGEPNAAKRSVTNKILAVLDIDPKEPAAAAKKAVRDWLRGQWETVMRRRDMGTSCIREEIARQQIGSFVEFYAAWSNWDGAHGESYQRARQCAELRLAGRKALREFKQPQKSVGVPKSPLDPSRDSVIKLIEDCSDAPLRLKPNEHLDAVSVLKRVLGHGGNVPSTSDIAARMLEASIEASGSAEEKTKLKVIQETAVGRRGFIGDLVFKTRREEILDPEAMEDPREVKAVRELQGRYDERDIPEADPYYAILLSDGDSMGKLISTKNSPEEHIELSEKLAAFADKVGAIVEEHSGHKIYAGGDDVLALLPVHTCVACAAKLSQTFQCVGSTLSVGIAVLHYHDPLQVGIRYARAAERLAKNKSGQPADRGNRLALTFHVRGGQARSAVWNWGSGLPFDQAKDDEGSVGSDDNTVADWSTWANAFDKGLSKGFPYELELLARETRGSEQLARLLKLEAARIFDRKKKAEGKLSDRDASRIQNTLNAVDGAAALDDLAKRLIVFRKLAKYPMEWPKE